MPSADRTFPPRCLERVLRRTGIRAHGSGSDRRTAAGISDAQIYDQHAAGLYRQALLTLHDARLAEQVVTDVIVDECTRPPARRTDADVSFRLAVSAYRRCQELSADPGWPGWHASDPTPEPSGSGAGGIEPGILGTRERAALALVLFGGLSHAQVCVVLAMPGQDVTALLRRVLHTLAGSAPGLLA
jgi:hypothetical protein